MTRTDLLARFVLMSSAIAAGCGDNGQHPDAAAHQDAANVDAPSFPAAPTLGAQLDRMGRPVVNNALNALLASPADATEMTDRYDQGAVASAWADLVLKIGPPDVTVKLEFARNLALFDVLDQGSGLLNNGCKNQALYNSLPSGGGSPVATSYDDLATLFADDQLYVDTSKSSCTRYLSLELEVATSGAIPHAHCGGRAPTHDVADVSYSLLTAGLAGFSSDGNLTPFVSDGAVSVHADVSDATFPFLGTPH